MLGCHTYPLWHGWSPQWHKEATTGPSSLPAQLLAKALEAANVKLPLQELLCLH
jgi:hypothetical protein